MKPQPCPICDAPMHVGMTLNAWRVEHPLFTKYPERVPCPLLLFGFVSKSFYTEEELLAAWNWKKPDA